MYGRIGELLLILCLVLILFGAGKMPKVMSDIGKGIRAFRLGLRGDEETKPEEEDKNH